MTRFVKVREKVYAGVPLDLDDGVALFRHPNLPELGMLANQVRERMHGDRAYYNLNLHINATNVCVADCMFCSFARLKPGDPGAYTMSLEQAWGKLRERAHQPITEIHIVNGLHPDLPFEYYEELLRGLKRIRPDIHLKCFTAVEIHFFAHTFGMSYEKVLTRLREAGLGSLPGGGAEIFAPRVRRKICADKATTEEWLDVHRVAHRMGLRSNCTMLYGHIETFEERVDHMLKLRALQDETGGFQTFIPLAFHPEGNALARLPAPLGYDDLRTYAVARLVLSNVPHLKAYWIMLGLKIAQVALWFGADDIDGTVQEEKIYHMAGAHTPEALTRAQLEAAIRAAGRVPVQRDTLYNIIETPPGPSPRRLEVVA
ncbi:MAG TPA: aminofutalosine synthase MqnE [Polyangia bacterium]|nr:aminofutalosine synthase MqnE [Polyangia bacterium]